MHEGDVDPHGGRVLMPHRSATQSEQRCFGGVQGFYEHASEALRRADAVRGLPAAGGAGPARACRRSTSSPADLHRGDVRHQGGRAARSLRQLGLALVTCDTSPRARASPATTRTGTSARAPASTSTPPRRRGRRPTACTPTSPSELPALVEASFPVRRDARGIFGHSMGGHGALALALRNPGRYRSVSRVRADRRAARGALGPKAFAGYLGRRSTRAGPSTTRARSCAARPLPGPLLVDQGTADKFLDARAEARAARGGVRRGRADADACVATRATTTATTSSPASSRSTSRTTRARSRPERCCGQARSAPDALAVAVATASISGGDRQS